MFLSNVYVFPPIKPPRGVSSAGNRQRGHTGTLGRSSGSTSEPDLRSRPAHTGELRHDVEHTLARAEADVLLEAGRAVGARGQTRVRVGVGLGDQAGGERCVSGLAAQLLDDPGRAQ